MKNERLGSSIVFSFKLLAFSLIGIWLIVALYFVWPGGRVEADSGHRPIMGTFARVVVVAADSSTANRCIEAAFAEIEKVDELMSDYASDSQICQVNRDGFRQAVEVSESTYEVLQRSVELSKLTGGAFDVTVGPLVDLFRLAEKKQLVPSEEKIAQARSKVGFEKLKLDDQNRTVKFIVDGMRLDLGGIAKGYAVDKAVEAMQNSGAIGGMVDLGGDIRCFGTPPQGKKRWLIGLQDPSGLFESTDTIVIPAQAGIHTNNLLLVLKLTDRAVATSGDYRQFILIEDKRYSHIIDRKTGAAAQTLSSVTIIADNATDADALATAVSVMGAEKGLALIETLPQTEAILIPVGVYPAPRCGAGMTGQPKYELIKTTGAEKFIK